MMKITRSFWKIIMIAVIINTVKTKEKKEMKSLSPLGFT